MNTISARAGFLLPSALLCLALFSGCQEPLPDADLLDNVWTLESIFAPGEPIILVGPARFVTIQFSDDSRLSGDSFCNQYGATYMVSENGALEIGSILTTLRGCLSNELHHNEDTYYLALPQSHSYRIDSHVLRLYYDDDSVLKYRLEV